MRNKEWELGALSRTGGLASWRGKALFEGFCAAKPKKKRLHTLLPSMSTPIKLTFGNSKANKPVLAKKAVAAFASNDTHEPAKKDEFISGIDGNKITR